MYSKREAEQKGQGWNRTGFDIKYLPSKKRALVQATQYYQLSFAVELNYENDQVYFAHCYPYTYTDCLLMLKRVCIPSHGKDRLRRTDLCRTKAGNACEMLIITNFTSS